MKILELRQKERWEPASTFDFASLSRILFESGDLLEEATASGDEEFRRAAIELAVQSLYTASSAIERFIEPTRALR